MKYSKIISTILKETAKLTSLTEEEFEELSEEIREEEYSGDEERILDALLDQTATIREEKERNSILPEISETEMREAFESDFEDEPLSFKNWDAYRSGVEYCLRLVIEHNALPVTYSEMRKLFVK